MRDLTVNNDGQVKSSNRRILADGSIILSSNIDMSQCDGVEEVRKSIPPYLNRPGTQYLGENQTFFGDSFLFSFQSKKEERNTSESFSSHWDRSLV